MSHPDFRSASFPMNACNQASTAAEPQIGPEPVHHNHNAISESDQEEDVRSAPQQPGWKTPNAEPTEFDDGAAPANGREVAVVAVFERRSCVPAQAGPN